MDCSNSLLTKGGIIVLAERNIMVEHGIYVFEGKDSWRQEKAILRPRVTEVSGWFRTEGLTLLGDRRS